MGEIPDAEWVVGALAKFLPEKSGDDDLYGPHHQDRPLCRKFSFRHGLAEKSRPKFLKKLSPTGC